MEMDGWMNNAHMYYVSKFLVSICNIKYHEYPNMLSKSKSKCGLMTRSIRMLINEFLVEKMCIESYGDKQHRSIGHDRKFVKFSKIC